MSRRKVNPKTTNIKETSALNSKCMQIWKDSKFVPPSIPILIHKTSSEIFAVIDDQSTVYRLLDQFGNIIALVPSSSSIKKSTYWSDGQSVLLNCRYSPKDQFVYNNIRPIIFNESDLFE